ncbi:MAG: hypothetical protein GY850_08415 [bacterium]|nr:hypothetical protein [bacterium]
MTPFKEGGDLPETTAPASPVVSTTSSPLTKTKPFKEEQYRHNDLPKIDLSDHERKKPAIPRSGSIFSGREKNLTSLSPRTNDSLPSSKIRSNNFMAEKPADEKSLEVKKQVIEKSEKIIKEIHTSEKSETVKPVAVNPDGKHKKAPSSKERTSKKKEKEETPESYKSFDKPVRPTIIIKNELKPSTPELKNNINPHKKNDRIIPEIQPKAPPNKQPSFSLKKRQKEKRLIIGNLRVEVLPSQPLKTSQATERKTQRIVKTQPRREKNSINSKLRFGLGQV